MSENRVTDKEELISHIERDWLAINQLLDSLTRDELTQIRNPDGWSIKDHIAHLAAWERSVVAFLSGQPRHEGFQITEELYLSHDLNAINHAIFERHKDDSLNQVHSLFQATHDELLTKLTMLDNEDLNKSYSHYLPNEPGNGDGPPAINIIYGNTAHHYREHQIWIEAMLKES